ncbi:MAG: hypothetical protein LH470_07335 [Lysobacter sp.]|nr:hypothetical protein [Lysobacter sp.]
MPANNYLANRPTQRFTCQRNMFAPTRERSIVRHWSERFQRRANTGEIGIAAGQAP